MSSTQVKAKTTEVAVNPPPKSTEALEPGWEEFGLEL